MCEVCVIMHLASDSLVIIQTWLHGLLATRVPFQFACMCFPWRVSGGRDCTVSLLVIRVSHSYTQQGNNLPRGGGLEACGVFSYLPPGILTWWTCRSWYEVGRPTSVHMYEEGGVGKHVTHSQIMFSIEECIYRWSLLIWLTGSTYAIGSSSPHRCW